MLTAFQLASLPIWGVGFAFVGVAIAIGLGFKKKQDKETHMDLMGQCAIGICFGIPFLLLSAWMWGQ